MTEYDFSALSPPDFEMLVADLLEADQELTFERFGPGRDHGIDLRCASDGSVIVQCKHYLRSGRDGLRRNLAKEAEKWREATDVSRYVLASSVSMVPGYKGELHEILRETLPVELGDILGLEDLNSLLAKHPEVEKRHIKLWLGSAAILDHIVHSGLWVRSEDLLETIEKRARVYVGTARYAEVLKKLESTNLCVLSGGPGVGKSLLAEMTLLDHWQRGWQVVQVSEDMQEGFDVWNPLKPQIFYYDDFLGQTDLAETLGKNEDNRIVKFADKVARAKAQTKRLILTTREQVLREAEQSSDRIRSSKFPLSTTVVQMGDYSAYLRGLILYNHLYFSNLNPEDRERLVADERYLNVIHHPNYSPRLVQLVVDRSADGLDALYADLDSSLKNPVDLWGSSFHHLSPVARKVLAVLATFPPRGIPERALRVLVDPADKFAYSQALKVLEGTWVRLRKGAGTLMTVTFANPSCRDFILHQADENPAMAEELLDLAISLEQQLLIFGYAKISQPSPPESPLKSATGYRRTQRLMGKLINQKEPIVQHPGLAAAITEDSVTFMERIRACYSISLHAARKEGKAANPFRPGETSVDLLLQVLPVIQALGEASDFIWFGQQLREYTSSLSKNATALSGANLLDLYIDCSLDPRIPESDRKYLLEAAMHSLESVEDFQLFAAIAPHIETTEEEMDDVRDRVNDLLDNEYDYYRHYADDPDEIRQAVDSLSSLAQRFGSAFSGKGDTLLERAYELEQDVEQAESPEAREDPDPEEEPSEDDDDRIRELFVSLIETVDPPDVEVIT